MVFLIRKVALSMVFYDDAGCCLAIVHYVATSFHLRAFVWFFLVVYPFLKIG